MNISIGQVFVIVFILVLFFGNFSSIIKIVANSIKEIKNTMIK
jgi:Sec-independent protein translocase protein TatA